MVEYMKNKILESIAPIITAVIFVQLITKTHINIVKSLLISIIIGIIIMIIVKIVLKNK